MISFRYHVVSIVSVLLALAVGLVLGAGPLRAGAGTASVGQAAGDGLARTDSASEVDDLRRTGRFTDDFAAAVAPGLVRGTLAGREVTLVALPTAEPAEVMELRRLVQVAGGRVGGTVRVSGKLVDVTNKELVDELGSQLEARASGSRTPVETGPYDRIGALLGRAVATRERGGQPVDSLSSTVLAGLSTAGLVSTESRLTRRGDLVLFVTGPGEGSAEARQGAATIVTSLVRSVDQVAAGTVLAGPLAAAGSGGQVRAVSADAVAARRVSTVGALTGTPGQVVTVLALAEQAAGRTGHYGAADAADGVVPRAFAPRARPW